MLDTILLIIAALAFFLATIQVPVPRINLVALNPHPLVAGGRIDFVALNPQPLPPGDDGRSIDFVALNPQPLPPEPPGGA